MTEVSLLQHLARTRIPDLMADSDGVQRGTCPVCGHFPPVSNRSFQVFTDRFACTDCGIYGDIVCLLRNADGLSHEEAVRTVAQMEARR